MSYYILKNLKLDPKNNKISASVADSSWRDANNKYIYDKTDDIYSSIPTWEEKYAHFIWSLLRGGIRIEGNNKYKRLEGLSGQKGLPEYYSVCSQNTDNELYLKYKDIIEDILNEKKEYIIRFKNSMAYLKSMGTKYYKYTFNVEEAKKYTKTEAKNIVGIKDFTVVNYKEELINSQKEKYGLYLTVLSNKSENDMLFDDIYQTYKKCRVAEREEQKIIAYTELYSKYPNNFLLEEIIRVKKGEEKKEFDFNLEIQNEQLEKQFEKSYINFNMLKKFEEENSEENEDEMGI